jgi:hypothetical protein
VWTRNLDGDGQALDAGTSSRRCLLFSDLADLDVGWIRADAVDTDIEQVMFISGGGRCFLFSFSGATRVSVLETWT